MKRNSEKQKSISTPIEKNKEEGFRYPLELVATIAAHFTNDRTTDTAATDRAIALLDAVSKNIKNRLIGGRAREEAARLSKETPKHLDFAKGIKWITGKRNEADATKAFRDYLRLNLRLCNIGHPGQLTDEQVKKLLTPLVDEGAKATEDKQVEDMMTRERKTGFNQVALITTREQLEKYQAGFVRPYRNAEKGKRGGRPRGEKKKSKKPLERKATLEK